MNNISTSVPMDQNIEPNQPTIAQPPSLDLPAPLPPDLHLPNWLLAILLITVLTERLRQLILVLIYLLQKLRQNKEV
jgi:hypothetical protein